MITFFKFYFENVPIPLANSPLLIVTVNAFPETLAVPKVYPNCVKVAEEPDHVYVPVSIIPAVGLPNVHALDFTISPDAPRFSSFVFKNSSILSAFFSCSLASSRLSLFLLFLFCRSPGVSLRYHVLLF